MNFKYEELEGIFNEGDVIHNFNGLDYRIMEKYSEQDLLLFDIKYGNFVIALGTTWYSQYDKEKIVNADKQEKDSNRMIAVQWQNGVYLGSKPSKIDFQELKEKYSEIKEINKLSEFRDRKREEFYFFQKIINSKMSPISLKKEASNCMYLEFMTGNRDDFEDNLDEGEYDQKFYQKSEKTEKIR